MGKRKSFNKKYSIKRTKRRTKRRTKKRTKKRTYQRRYKNTKIKKRSYKKKQMGGMLDTFRRSQVQGKLGKDSRENIKVI